MRADRWRHFVAKTLPEPPLSVPPSIESLERRAQQAAAEEQWGTALAYVSHILERGTRVTSVRRRAMVNRATALHTIGRLTEAVSAYNALPQETEVWAGMAPEFRTATTLSGLVVQCYLDMPLDLDALQNTTPMFNRAPFTWSTYWWLMGHLAWKRNPEQLVSIRRSSQLTFDDTWNRGFDRSLWGLDLLNSLGTAHRATMERRVREALCDPETMAVIGRIGWFDLYTDFLWYLGQYEPLRAADAVNQLITWCDARGFTGWASYWRHRTGPTSALTR